MFRAVLKILLVSAPAVVLFIQTSCSDGKAALAPDTTAAADLVTGSASPEIDAAIQLIRQAPDSPVGFTRLAAVYIKKARSTGDFDLNTRAETAIDRALEIDPENVSARKLQASLCLTFHRFAAARDLGLKLTAEFPSEPFGYGVLTDANAELGEYETAVASAQKMIDLKPNSPSYARVAHLRSVYGDHAGAVQMFELAARTADPQDKEAQSWCLVQLGDEYWKNGKYEKAEAVYDEALKILPAYYLAVNSKGRIRAARGDFKEAIRILADATRRVPNVDAIILLGDLYHLSGTEDAARQQYDLAGTIEQKLGLAGDQKRLALMLADQDCELDKALEIAAREYSLRKDIYTADVYAWCLFKNGRNAEAKRIIDEASRLKTNDARILYHRGMIEKLSGDTVAGIKFLQTALKINPAFDLIQSDKARQALETEG